MKLREIEIHKYKAFEEKQSFKLEDDITILVGMNESGKTSVLESVAKTHYFQKDGSFKFNVTHDYPRKEKKKMDKSGVVPEAITCMYEISDEIINEIERDLGENTFTSRIFNITSNYNNESIWSGVVVDKKAFVAAKTKKLEISSKILNEKLENVKSINDLKNLRSEYSDDKYTKGLSSLDAYFKNVWNWQGDDVLGEYVARIYLNPKRSKFLYYDEYYSLPSRISIEKLVRKELDGKDYKTAKALIELADINVSELLKADDFEDFIAELEATESTISDELFKYWTTNKNLHITFQIDKKERTDIHKNTRIVEHILDIRVKSKGVSLPLKNRSKGWIGYTDSDS